jgi:hypothetical protein
MASDIAVCIFPDFCRKPKDMEMISTFQSECNPACSIAYRLISII